MSDSHDPAERDPARMFLDQTVPRADDWAGRETEDGPARPRHVQHPVVPGPLPDPRKRRRDTIRAASWTFGPTAGYLAASALSSDAEPTPDPDPPADYGDVGSAL